MAVSVNQDIAEGRVFFIGNRESDNQTLTEGRVFAVYNVPAVEQQISQGYVFALTTVRGPQEMSEGRVFAIVRGRVAQARLRAWTFTLDGHDFYVLRLGEYSTIVYDVYSEQWVDWDSPGLAFWRASLGMTWIGGQALAATYGSSIVAGDDTYGLLWFLDPELPYDQSPDAAREIQQLPFDRVVTGQVLAKGRQYLPCYSVILSGDNYGLTANDFVPSIKLETSDDQGRNFDDQGSLSVVLDLTVNNPYEWGSLGQIASPGRIFRVTDNGIYTRIDGMEMNDDAG